MSMGESMGKHRVKLMGMLNGVDNCMHMGERLRVHFKHSSVKAWVW